MTKDNMIALVRKSADEAEEHYLHVGPNKREQEDHIQIGTSVVNMNVELLVGWLDCHGHLGDWEDLSKADRREVWEASGFHFGIMGYEEHDADFWWEHEAQ
jgi:hypothetical protein